MKNADWLEQRLKLKQKADTELEQHRREEAAKLGIGYESYMARFVNSNTRNYGYF